MKPTTSTTNRPLRVLALSGSLRQDSWNTALLRAAAALAPDDVTIERFDLRGVPLYDGDADPAPAVAALKEAVAMADAVLIATPEYNYGIPGVLKNALDHASRPAYRSVFAGKPTALVSASPSPMGGSRAQAQLKLTLLAMLAEVFPAPELAVAAAPSRFDEDGRLVDEETIRRLSRFVTDFAGWTRAHVAARAELDARAST